MTDINLSFSFLHEFINYSYGSDYFENVNRVHFKVYFTLM